MKRISFGLLAVFPVLLFSQPIMAVDDRLVTDRMNKRFIHIGYYDGASSGNGNDNNYLSELDDLTDLHVLNGETCKFHEVMKGRNINYDGLFERGVTEFPDLEDADLIHLEWIDPDGAYDRYRLYENHPDGPYIRGGFFAVKGAYGPTCRAPWCNSYREIHIPFTYSFLTELSVTGDTRLYSYDPNDETHYSIATRRTEPTEIKWSFGMKQRDQNGRSRDSVMIPESSIDAPPTQWSNLDWTHNDFSYDSLKQWDTPTSEESKYSIIGISDILIHPTIDDELDTPIWRPEPGRVYLTNFKIECI